MPRHTHRYANLAETITTALQSYAQEVRSGAFPSAQHSATMGQEELQEALRQLEHGAVVG